MYGLAVAAASLIRNQTQTWQNHSNIYYTDDRDEKERRDKIMKDIYALRKELDRLVKVLEKMAGEQN